MITIPAAPRRRLPLITFMIMAGCLGLAACGGGGDGGGGTDTPTTPATPSSAPGAPLIGAATAGNASASIAFTAPASAGSSPITLYTASCVAGGVTRTQTGTGSPIAVTGLINGTAYVCSVAATNAVGAGPASATVTVTPVDALASYSTAAVDCPFSQSTFNAGLNLTSTSQWTCAGTIRTLLSNGIPNHATGTFPTIGNPNTISVQNIRFTATTAPRLTAIASNLTITGYARNGVKFEPSTAQTCTTNCANNGQDNTGTWRIEALGQTYFRFGTDQNNAHVQPNGEYHYHGMPEGLITTSSAMILVGFAADGFPIYARYGYTNASNAGSGLKTLTSSYRLKTTLDTGRPATTIAAAGTFTQDYEYVEGLGDLDQCNGRVGVTPEFPAGIYYYAITDAYPYISRCVKGAL